MPGSVTNQEADSVPSIRNFQKKPFPGLPSAFHKVAPTRHLASALENGLIKSPL
jgi:hypothetical protein